MKINTTALARSAIFAIWYVVAVTIGMELYPPLKTFFIWVSSSKGALLFGNFTGQHWAGKSILTAVLTFVAYLILSRMKESEKPEKGIWAVLVSAVLGGFAIFGYFLWHYLNG